MSISIKDLIKQGAANKQALSEKEELTKVGTLRGGSSGALAMGGRPLGTCPRLAALRFKGLRVEEHEESRGFMFDAGNSNEDIWYDVLGHAYPPSQILRESEVPITWDLNGVKVTGRPDIVLTDAERKPVIGLELKLVCSFWTARSVLFEKAPKTGHLIQAAFYSWRLGIPFELWYASRVDWTIMCQAPKGNQKWDWVAKMLPKPGEPLAEHLEYSYYVRDDSNKFGWRKLEPEEFSNYSFDQIVGVPKKCKPFAVGYELKWQGNQLWYRLANPTPEQEGSIDWVQTLITKEGIQAFYQTIIDATKSGGGTLPPRISRLEADGSNANYSKCSYCDLKSLCDSYEGSDFETWYRAAAALVAKASEEKANA